MNVRFWPLCDNGLTPSHYEIFTWVLKMQVRHVDEVRKSLGGSTLDLLKTIFEQSNGLPPTVPATRFRAKYPKWMDQLNDIGHSDFLVKVDHTKDTYRVSGYVLPLLESKRASRILLCLEAAYTHLRNHYDKHLREPIKVGDLLAAVKDKHGLLTEALCYMSDVGGWWSSYGNNFPLDSNEVVVVNEQVLKHESFSDFIAQVYEWNFVSPVKYPGGRTWVDEIGLAPTFSESDRSGPVPDVHFVFEELLHPVVRDNALRLFLDGHLREAVLNSVVAVFDFIRHRTGISEDGEALISRALSLKNPLLILSDVSSESGQNDQIGFMQIFKGAYQGIRNPKAHSLTHDLTAHKAAQYLVFASLLARRIEEATQVQRRDP